MHWVMIDVLPVDSRYEEPVQKYLICSFGSHAFVLRFSYIVLWIVLDGSL